MKVRYLDCSTEVTEILQPAVPAMQWLANDLVPEDWRIEVGTEATAEILQLAEYLETNPLPVLQRRLDDFKLPACRNLMLQMKAILDQGVGFAVLDRLPMDSIGNQTLVEIYWLLGQYIGRPVAQKWNGQMIYDVRDTGEEYGYGTRGSHTRVELNFHTDNAFARMLPDYVGLFCRNPAKKGGVSRFCSLYSLHQRLLDTSPDLLQRLYQPMLFDRQQEHAPGAAPVCLAPYFSWRNQRLFARANVSLVRQGYQVADEPMDQLLADALDVVDEISASADLWYEAPLQSGQIQYLNNHEIGHYRSAFEDFAEPALQRHLFRLWHRETGSASYDGN